MCIFYVYLHIGICIYCKKQCMFRFNWYWFFICKDHHESVFHINDWDWDYSSNCSFLSSIALVIIIIQRYMYSTFKKEYLYIPAIFRSRIFRQRASAFRIGQFSIFVEKLRKKRYSFNVTDIRRAILIDLVHLWENKYFQKILTFFQKF